jgi:hypothetical protein
LNTTDKISEKFFLTMFASFSLIMSTHAAMRLALIGFTYGLAFMRVTEEFASFRAKPKIIQPEEDLMEAPPEGFIE